MILYEELSQAILDSAFEVHNWGGPGALESSYQACMERELTLRNIPFRPQVELPLIYKGLQLDKAYRLDLIVDEKIVVELKAVERILPVHEAQLLTDLRLTGLRVGLLINFNVARLKDGIIRRII